MKKIIAVSIAFMSSASIAYAIGAVVPGAGSTSSVSSAVSLVVQYINLAIEFLILAAVAYVIWNGFKFVMAGGDAEKRDEARSGIIYGLIGVAVMLSVWGLVTLVMSSTGLSTTKTIVVPAV